MTHPSCIALVMRGHHHVKPQLWINSYSAGYTATCWQRRLNLASTGCSSRCFPSAMSPPRASGAVLSPELDMQVAAAVALVPARRLLCEALSHDLLHCLHKCFVKTLSIRTVKVLTALCMCVEMSSWTSCTWQTVYYYLLYLDFKEACLHTSGWLNV